MLSLMVFHIMCCHQCKRGRLLQNWKKMKVLSLMSTSQLVFNYFLLSLMSWLQVIGCICWGYWENCIEEKLQVFSGCSWFCSYVCVSNMLVMVVGSYYIKKNFSWFIVQFELCSPVVNCCFMCSGWGSREKLLVWISLWWSIMTCGSRVKFLWLYWR